VVSRIVMAALALALVAPAVARGEAARSAEQAAAEHFRIGSEHYAAGRYREALTEFEAARQLLPHRATLFNMARCHENLGDLREALDLYSQTLELTTAPEERADVEGRIERIRVRPVRIFVASEPPGATVTVDANEAAEPSPTPITVELAPGAHRLLLSRDGYQLTAQRVVVEVGQEQPVTVALDPLPASEPPAPAAAPTPAPAPCPECRLNVRQGLRVEMSLDVETAYFSVGQWQRIGSTGGVGFRTHLSFNHLIVGGMISFAFQRPNADPTTSRNDNATFVQLLAEAGYLFPIGNTAVARVTGGVGGILEVFETAPGSETYSTNGAIHGYVGGGIDVHALRWLSIGVDLHVGAGRALDTDARGYLNGFDLIVLVGGYLNFNFGERRR
jgi:hypothetical protein